MVISYVALGALSSGRADLTSYYRRRAGNATFANIAPWLLLLLAAVVLEVIGLALGGRSSTVPTLSTVVDHLLVRHVGRWLLYVTWMAVGTTPIWRLWLRRGNKVH
jgi:DMSO reductase anchor subunit